MDEIVAFFERLGGPLGLGPDCLALVASSLDRDVRAPEHLE